MVLLPAVVGCSEDPWPPCDRNGEPPLSEVSVGDSLTPEITWSGDGVLALGVYEVVGDGFSNRWYVRLNDSFEDELAIEFAVPPIVYGDVPPGGREPEGPAVPLVDGGDYLVRLYTGCRAPLTRETQWGVLPAEFTATQ